MQIMHQTRQKNVWILLSNTQELKTRSYTRPQLPKNVQNITRHNRWQQSLFAHKKKDCYIQPTGKEYHKSHKKNSQFIAINSIPFPQTVLTMYNKLTMVMLPAGVKNSQDYDSHNFLRWCNIKKAFVGLDPRIYWSPVRLANHYTKVSTVSERHRKACNSLQSWVTGSIWKTWLPTSFTSLFKVVLYNIDITAMCSVTKLKQSSFIGH